MGTKHFYIFTSTSLEKGQFVCFLIGVAALESSVPVAAFSARVILIANMKFLRF